MPTKQPLDEQQPPGTETPAPVKPVPEIAGAVIAAGILSADKMVEQVGHFNEQQIETARGILDSIPADWRAAVAEPFGARAVIYALLLDPRAGVEAGQLQVLEQQADPQVLALTRQLADSRAQLPQSVRLPLLELSLPALQSLSPDQYRRFREVVQAMIAVDKKVDLKEWILQRLVIQQLDQHFGLRKPPGAVHGKLEKLESQVATMLSLLAHTEHADPQQAEPAFRAGATEAGFSELELLPRDALNHKTLNDSLDTLEQLKPLAKPRLLKACAVCLLHDGNTTIPAQELLRTIAACLDSPMPILVKSAEF